MAKGDTRHFHRWLSRRQREGDWRDYRRMLCDLYVARRWVAMETAALAGKWLDG